MKQVSGSRFQVLRLASCVLTLALAALTAEAKPPAFDLGAYQETLAKYAKTEADAKWSRKAGVLDFPYVKARLAKEGPRTYLNYGEDPDFAPTLIALEDAAKALGPQVAAFRGLKTMDEKRAFYRLASDKLFNYAHDVRAAYAAQLKKGLFE